MKRKKAEEQNTKRESESDANTPDRQKDELIKELQNRIAKLENQFEKQANSHTIDNQSFANTEFNSLNCESKRSVLTHDADCQSKALLKSILESPRGSNIFSLDKSYCYCAFSLTHKENMQLIWGTEIENGMCILDIISDPDFRIKAKSNFNRALKGEHFVINEDFNDENFLKKAWEQRYSPIYNEKAEIIGLTVVVNEITDSLVIRKQLVENEKRFKALIENSIDAISLVDKSGQVIYHSPSYAKIMGYSEAERINRNTFELVHPEDKKLMVHLFEEVLKFSSEVALPPTRVLHQNGTWQWIEGMAKNMLNVNYVNAVVVNFRNISEQKKAEQALRESEIKYKTIFSRAIEGIAIFTHAFKMVDLNESFAQILGFRVEELINRSLYDLVIPESQTAITDQLNILKESGSIQFEAWHSHKDGQLILLEVLANNISIQGEKHIIAFFRDHSERKMAEKKLKESEEKYRFLAENLSDVIWTADLGTGNIDYISPSVYKLFGFTPEQVMNNMTNYNSFTTETFLSTRTEIENETKYLIQNKSSEKSKRIEYQRMHKDGKLFWCETEIQVLYDQNNLSHKLLGITRSIETRKQAEQALQENREKLDAIFQNSLDGILLVDEQGNITDWNPGMERITGMKKEETLGEKVWKLQSLLVTEDMKEIYDEGEFEKIWKNNILNLQVKEIRLHTGKIKSASGQIKIVEDLVNPLFINGKRYICIIQREITQRKLVEEALRESEIKYKNIIDNLTDVYYRADANGLLTMASSSGLTTFGYDTMDEIIGQPIALLYQNKEERAEFLELIIKNKKVRNYRTTLLKKDGSEIFVETTANIIEDNEGKFAGVEGIVRDITERKTAELALLENANRMHELNTTKDKLFSIIAHDLKSPFTCILGFSELMEGNINDLSTQEIEEYSRHISTAARNTLSLLDNLLSWSKTQTGQITFKPLKINLKPVVNELINVFTLSAKMKKIELINLVPLQFSIFADQNMVQTILRNLISNAIKFTKSGGEVRIEAVQHENYHQISVKDNGIGMDQSAISKLFRTDSNYTIKGTANEKGSGLGLILCKEFVEIHKGKIWAESEPGKGSRFIFNIPINP